MPLDLLSYDDACSWVEGAANAKPTLLLGNGFSVAQDYARFSYSALVDAARQAGHIGARAEQFFEALGTVDFELVIQQLSIAATALGILDSVRFQAEITELSEEADALKEALALTLASLHPERPNEISDAAYHRVRSFLSHFKRVYTASYDLLLYWAIMQDATPELGGLGLSDDGFREADHEADYVVWDYLDAHTQDIYYLHGALHVYRDVESAELQKLTWRRTNSALIDQIRAQLAQNRFPLIITEGTSAAKLAKIQTSDYLARALRSLKQASGGMLAYGLSFSTNDEHLMKAIVESTVQRLAVSIFGDPNSAGNTATTHAINNLVRRRASRRNSRSSLEVRFFDASSVQLWN